MRKTPQHTTVLVGIGGSAGSRSAIRLAAEEAGYRGAELIAVMAYCGELALEAPGGGPVAALRTADDERAVAEAALRDTVADALGDQAEKVQLRTVLGSRGSASMLLGTVSQYVLRKAPCPVLVVPEPVVTARPAAAGHSPPARRR